MRILFDSRLPQFKTPFGCLKEGGECALHIMIPVHCQTVRCVLLLLQEDGSAYREVELPRETEDPLYETYGGTFRMETRGLYFYYFRITTKNECFRLFRQGSDTNMEAGDLWQLSVTGSELGVPESVWGSVMYQIFPDRFHAAGKCDCAEKLQPYWVHESTQDWPVYRPDERGEILNNDFFGGNLPGITEKLPYLQSLGVEILYLNPIFMAYSTHRYDTYDYSRIDPMLGTESDFETLCREAHRLGMRVILDGVFSHVGDRSIYFRSAVSDPASPYRSWFTFRHYPDDYLCWWDFKTLPCLNKRDPTLIDYLIEDENSIAAKWLRLGADGYRLDVVDELPDEFVLRLKKRIRSIKPEALLIGEVWEDASNKIAYDVRRRYFVDRELDSVMNYPWRDAILRYVRGEDDGASLAERVMTLAENYPPEVLHAVMNILDTHDTARAVNALLDPTDGEREELARRHFSPEDLARGKTMLRMAAFLQFTLPGMACIYYGDEAGLDGYRDPFNRKYYPWGREDAALLNFYRELAQIKRRSPALRRGELTVLEAGGGRLMFRRKAPEETLTVCCNRSGENWSVPHSGHVRFGVNLYECMPGTVTVAPGGCCIMERA